jgi:hypothetical protein
MSLLIALLLLVASISPFPVISDLADAFESCDIDISKIQSILMTASQGTAAEVDIESVLSTEVIDSLEPNAQGQYETIPDGTELTNIGVIIRSKIQANWASFGIVVNTEMERYWLILFPTNIFLLDSVSCGAFELRLEMDEGDV